MGRPTSEGRGLAHRAAELELNKRQAVAARASLRDGRAEVMVEASWKREGDPGDATGLCMPPPRERRVEESGRPEISGIVKVVTKVAVDRSSEDYTMGKEGRNSANTLQCSS